MRIGIIEAFWGHHLDELDVFKICAGRIDPMWPEILNPLKFPDGEKTAQLVRRRHRQAVEWFDIAVQSTGMPGPQAFKELEMPAYLGSAFGVPHLAPVGFPDKFGRYIFEPSSRMRWPSLRSLCADIRQTEGTVSNRIHAGKPIKGRRFQYALGRGE